MSYQDFDYTGQGTVPCVNAGSSPIPSAAPVQVVGVTITDKHAVLQVAQIGSGSYAAFNRNIAFNGPEAITAGAYGAVSLSQPVQTLWDTGTPSPGDVWGIAPGQYSLTKNGVGEFLVDGIIDSGTKRMYGRWMGIPTLLTKYAGSTTPLTPGSSGTFNIWSGAAGSEAVTSGPWTVTGLSRFEPVDKTGFATLQLIDGVWYAIESEHLALQLSGTISSLTSLAGNSCTFTVGSYFNGAWPGSSVTAYDADGVWGTVSSTKQARVFLNRWDGKYYLEWVQC